ncbi:MAG TPA: response regulator [Chloroflexia bacterium]|nr:response regulator [Chloroflexia bacterium]
MTYTVLIVEDSDTNREMLATLLRRNGYRVTEARDGIEGIEVALSDPPDLVLMDLFMPRLNGWEATRRLKQDPTLAHVPVIAVSAGASPADAQAALEAGCVEYITKPIALATFLRLIGQYLTAPH